MVRSATHGCSTCGSAERSLERDGSEWVAAIDVELAVGDEHVRDSLAGLSAGFGVTPVERAYPDREGKVIGCFAGFEGELLDGTAPCRQPSSVDQVAGSAGELGDRCRRPIDRKDMTALPHQLRDCSRRSTGPTSDLDHSHPPPQRECVDDRTQPRRQSDLASVVRHR
jgi:hypothetical protein